MAKKIVLRTLLLLGLLYLSLILLGSTLVPPVYTATSELILDSNAEKSWKVLTDFEDYGKWNPYLIKVDGVLAVGEPVTITLVNDNFDKPFTTTPHIASVNTAKQFHWENGFSVPGIYDTRHFFVLETISNEQTRLLQFEEFRGVLVWLLPGKEKRKAGAEEGFRQMNKALNAQLQMP